MNRWNRWEKLVFGAFLFWAAAGLLSTLAHLSYGAVATSGMPGWLRGFVEDCLRWGDPILILLAFANTHLVAARQWGAVPARRWALVVIAGALLIETVGVSTGFPFGWYQYTDRFGPRIGVVPLTIPLAWQIVVTNSLFLVRGRAPGISRLLEAGLTALLCTMYDFVLEPFATGGKQYWAWRGGIIPLQNYAAWFILSGLLVWLLAPKNPLPYPRDPRPAWLLTTTLLIFLAGRWSEAR